METFGLSPKENGWDRLGLAILLLFGILFAVVTPPFEVPGFAILAATQDLKAAPELAKQDIGKLAWLDTRLPAPLVDGVFLVIVLTALTCGCQAPALSGAQRLLLALVLFASVAWITILLYIMCLPYGSPVVVGTTQGRYFIPLGPLAFLLLANRRWCVDWNQKRPWLAAWACLSLAGTLAVVVLRY